MESSSVIRDHHCQESTSIGDGQVQIQSCILRSTSWRYRWRSQQNSQQELLYSVTCMATTSKWIPSSTDATKLPIKVCSPGQKLDSFQKYLPQLSRYSISACVNSPRRRPNTTLLELWYGMNSKWPTASLWRPPCMVKENGMLSKGAKWRNTPHSLFSLTSEVLG